MKTFCMRLYNREYMRTYRARNLEKMREYGRSQHAKNKESRNAKKRAARALHRDKYNAYQRAYHEANKDRFKVYYERSRKGKAKRIKKTPEQIRERRKQYHFKKLYGISQQVFDEMFERQNKQCAICKCGSGRWVVDHCHDTGQVRGILCNNCNLAIGLLKHSTSTLDSAREYLSKIAECGILKVA